MTLITETEYMKHHTVMIKFKQYKKFQTKVIYNSHITLSSYIRQPFTIKFSNPMVNDINQDVCGGWTAFGWDISDNDIILSRVLDGLKPVGALVVEPTRVNELLGYIDSDKYYVKVTEDYLGRGNTEIIVCPNKTLGDLFDLKTLEEDYSDVGISINAVQYSDVPISKFADDFDEHAPWVTGLIMGYPVENTISCYKC